MKKTVIKWTIISILFCINCVQIVELRRFREQAETAIKQLNAEINLSYDRDTEQCEMISRIAKVMTDIVERGAK